VPLQICPFGIRFAQRKGQSMLGIVSSVIVHRKPGEKMTVL
jgi:hypothetical protein